MIEEGKLTKFLQTIKGWTSRADLLTISKLVDAVPENGVIVELGTGNGLVTVVLAERCKECGIKVYSIDDASQFANYDFDEGWAQKTMNELGLSNFVTLMVGKSSEISKTFPFAIDRLYIDASHHYIVVCDDIRLWYPKIKKGGIILGHDFITNNTDGLQVIKAVFDTLICGLSKDFLESIGFASHSNFRVDGTVWSMEKRWELV